MPLGPLAPDPIGEFPTPPDNYISYLLVQLSLRRQSLLDAALQEIGLNISRWRAMLAVRRLVTCTMSELARLAGVDRTTLTRAVDNLVEEGVMQRSGSPTDRRQVILSMTEAGMEAYHQALALQNAVAAHILDGVDEEAQRVTCRTLERMLRTTIGDEELARDVLGFRICARDEEAAIHP